MKANYIIVLGGLLLLIIGIAMLSFEIYGNSSFRMSVEEELMILFGLIAGGLIITGIGIMLEFARRKYSVRK